MYKTVISRADLAYKCPGPVSGNLNRYSTQPGELVVTSLGLLQSLPVSTTLRLHAFIFTFQ